MPRALSPDSTLDALKKEAKRWLKALRADDADARRRLLAATPAARAVPSLRDVQLALAREHGVAGWQALRAALDDLALARRPPEELVAIVLRSAWQGDLPAARRILARWPAIGTASPAAAVATGDLAAVERALAADPAAATRPDGPHGWQPLLYLAYARLAPVDAPALAIAGRLLDHGADPNARFDDGWGNSFAVLTGVIGEGEGDRPPHPQADALARLLIERGADPFDAQALYNTSITRDDVRWLDFLWNASAARGMLDRWRAVPAPIGGVVPLSVLDYLLGNAVAFDHPARAEWLLRHGANPDGVHAYSRRPQREEALVHGHRAMADLLVRHGAAERPLEGQAAFSAAVMALDRATAQRLAAEDPGLLREAEPMLTAARQGRADVVALLLAVGMDVDVADGTGQRGLHNAVMGNSLSAAKLLVDHGADIDRPTTRFDGPMGFAAHFGRREIAAFLAPLSRDVHNMAYLGLTERLAALFAEDPGLVDAAHHSAGITPLFCIPDDEDAAVAMTEFLLAHGAEPQARNKDGVTAEQAARNRGLADAADLMGGEDAAA